MPAIAAILSLALATGPVGSASAQTAPTAKPFKNPVSMSGKDRRGRNFTGTFRIERFVRSRGKTWAEGDLRGKLGSRRVRRDNVRIPATLARQGANGAQVVPPGVCQVLRLQLGPLDLNLLGLRVQLNQVNLLITAIPSNLPGGGLLGDLLCAVTNLLNPTGLTPAQLAAILNALLALLGG